jgi:hypothetical protein
MRKANDLRAAEYARADYVHEPEIGVTKDDLEDPVYWANYARQLKPWDRIEVRGKGRAWYAELMVRAVEQFAVKVHVLEHIVFDKEAIAGEPDPAVPAGYELQNRGKSGWHVKRKKDGVVLTEKVEPVLQTKTDAARWLERHLKALAA